jgi:hypothetical protein
LTSAPAGESLLGFSLMLSAISYELSALIALSHQLSALSQNMRRTFSRKAALERAAYGKPWVRDE